MGHTRGLLMDAMPGVRVVEMEIGDGILDSLFWPMDQQVSSMRARACMCVLLQCSCSCMKEHRLSVMENDDRMMVHHDDNAHGMAKR